MTARSMLALLACATLGACSQNSGGGLPRQNLDLITREQLAENRFVNAFDAVRSMRSNWLQPHGTNSFQNPSEVLVYLDDIKLGGVDQLSSITAMRIAFIRYFDGTEATSRWGVGHAAGVIQVSTFTERRQ